MRTLEAKRDEARDRLREYNIRPSQQRVAIMQYLLNHYTHPSVDEIYDNLSPLVPTLSKTTVYNTLRMFADVGAACMVTIDDHHVMYDGNNHPHAHFICRRCGCVKDMHGDELVPEAHPRRMQNGCLIDEVQIYYKGICPECLGNAE